MATPAEPATDALYQALSSPNPDPQIVQPPSSEIRYLSGQNVIAVLGAKIDAQTARIDVLQRVIWRVIWPLIILLAAPTSGCSTRRSLARRVAGSKGILKMQAATGRERVCMETGGCPAAVRLPDGGMQHGMVLGFWFF